MQSRTYSQENLNENISPDIKPYGFTNVKPVKNGKIIFRIYNKETGKRLFIPEAAIHIYNGGEIYIELSKNCKKSDYLAYKNRELVSLEGKPFEQHVLAEIFNISKTKSTYYKFLDLCDIEGFDPVDVNNKFNKTIIEKFGMFILDEIFTTLPDYFAFHKNGHTMEPVLIDPENLILELITKNDESGNQIKLRRLSVNYFLN